MKLVTEDCVGSTVIHVSGNLLGRNVANLTQAIRECSRSRVVIDLRGVTRIDSCGIGSLIYSYSLLLSQSRKLLVSSPPDFVKKILEDFASPVPVATDLLVVS